MTECNPLSTPMEQNLRLTSIEGKEFEDATKYRQLIGSLIYLTTTRPDIHLLLESSPGLCKSLVRDIGAVSWRSRKQSVPADPTTEAEYVAAAEATKEIVWLRKILEDLQVKQVQSTPLMIDNNSAIKLAKNPKFHDRTKNINTKYHLISDIMLRPKQSISNIVPQMSKLQTSSPKRLEEKSLKDSERCLDSPTSLQIKGGNVDT
eukprot:PITA_29214